jgi:hypothetical protein
MHLHPRQEDLTVPEPVDNFIDGGMLPKAPVPRLHDDIAPETAPFEDQTFRFRGRMDHSRLGTGGIWTTIALLKKVEASGQGYHVFVPNIPTAA